MRRNGSRTALSFRLFLVKIRNDNNSPSTKNAIVRVAVCFVFNVLVKEYAFYSKKHETSAQFHLPLLHHAFQRDRIDVAEQNAPTFLSRQANDA